MEATEEVARLRDTVSGLEGLTGRPRSLAVGIRLDAIVVCTECRGLATVEVVVVLVTTTCDVAKYSDGEHAWRVGKPGWFK